MSNAETLALMSGGCSGLLSAGEDDHGVSQCAGKVSGKRINHHSHARQNRRNFVAKEPALSDPASYHGFFAHCFVGADRGWVLGSHECAAAARRPARAAVDRLVLAQRDAGVVRDGVQPLPVRVRAGGGTAVGHGLHGALRRRVRVARGFRALRRAAWRPAATSHGCPHRADSGLPGALACRPTARMAELQRRRPAVSWATRCAPTAGYSADARGVEPKPVHAGGWRTAQWLLMWQRARQQWGRGTHGSVVAPAQSGCTPGRWRGIALLHRVAVVPWRWQDGLARSCSEHRPVAHSSLPPARLAVGSGHWHPVRQRARFGLLPVRRLPWWLGSCCCPRVCAGMAARCKERLRGTCAAAAPIALRVHWSTRRPRGQLARITRNSHPQSCNTNVRGCHSNCGLQTDVDAAAAALGTGAAGLLTAAARGRNDAMETAGLTGAAATGAAAAAPAVAAAGAAGAAAAAPG